MNIFRYFWRLRLSFIRIKNYKNIFGTYAFYLFFDQQSHHSISYTNHNKYYYQKYDYQNKTDTDCNINSDDV